MLWPVVVIHLVQVLVVVAVEVALVELVVREVEQGLPLELGEVELALEEVELALEALVLALEEANLLKSFVVLEEGGPQVGRAQSNCIGIQEVCPLLQ